METKQEVLDDFNMHFEHKQWRGELAFWEDELKSFNNRLAELLLRWTDKKVLAQLEDFQNAFTRHGQVIDKLQQEINEHEADMSEKSAKGENCLDRELAKSHIDFRTQIEIQRKIYADLKKDFFRFLSKYM